MQQQLLTGSMDHETLIGDIESRAGHENRAADSEGEYMGSVPHEDRKLQNLATTIRSWEELRCSARD